MQLAQSGVSNPEPRSALMVRTRSSPGSALMGRLLAARALSLAIRPEVSSSAAATALVELAKGSQTALSLALAHLRCRDSARTGSVAQRAAAALRLARAAVEREPSRAAETTSSSSGR